MNTSTTNPKPTRKNALSKMYEVEIVYKGPQSEDVIKVNSPTDAYKAMLNVFDTRKLDYKELFYVILLNRANCCIAVSKIGEGSTTGVVVNIKEIFQLVLRSNACGVILAHNHPSGSLVPSTADKEITKKVKDACSLLDCTLIDHIILTSENYFSFTSEGLI